jgi:hypothetical protein
MPQGNIKKLVVYNGTTEHGTETRASTPAGFKAVASKCWPYAAKENRRLEVFTLEGELVFKAYYRNGKWHDLL